MVELCLDEEGSERFLEEAGPWLERLRVFHVERGIILLVVGLTAFFGAGTVDMFTDIVPMRPYSGFFVTGLALRKRHSGHRDYNANRDVTHYIEQINEPLEQYARKKLEAFKSFKRKRLA